MPIRELASLQGTGALQAYEGSLGPKDCHGEGLYDCHVWQKDHRDQQPAELASVFKSPLVHTMQCGHCFMESL